MIWWLVKNWACSSSFLCHIMCEFKFEISVNIIIPYLHSWKYESDSFQKYSLEKPSSQRNWILIVMKITHYNSYSLYRDPIIPALIAFFDCMSSFFVSCTFSCSKASMSPCSTSMAFSNFLKFVKQHNDGYQCSTSQHLTLLVFSCIFPVLEFCHLFPSYSAEPEQQAIKFNTARVL